MSLLNSFVEFYYQFTFQAFRDFDISDANIRSYTGITYTTPLLFLCVSQPVLSLSCNVPLQNSVPEEVETLVSLKTGCPRLRESETRNSSRHPVHSSASSPRAWRRNNRKQQLMHQSVREFITGPNSNVNVSFPRRTALVEGNNCLETM